MQIIKVLIVVFLIVIFTISLAYADAIIIVRAMTASTIAEIFIEKDHVEVEIEIGFADLEAFTNILPDDLLNRMKIKAPSVEQRLKKFFFEDMTIRPDDGPPIAGYVQAMKVRQRIKRDEITGEPIPAADGEGEDVLAATFIYPFKARPKTLLIKPPKMASIGFVAYHKGLPVNDFRYLSSEQTIDLDWEDPWYSKFENKNLWRAYNAPINTFLYVEPFEVRVEIIVRPKDLQQWLDFGLENHDTLPVERQAEVKEKISSFLAKHFSLNVDGQIVTPSLERINFLMRTLRASVVIEPAQELELVSATLGVIFTYQISKLPQDVTLTWELFSEKYPVVRAAATDEAGPMPYILKPEDNMVQWKNYLKNPTIPALVKITPPEEFLKSASWETKIRNIFSQTKTIPEQDVQEILSGLLRNIYHAFDYKDEDSSYDVLAKSVSGDLLTQIYLETRRSLELKKLGGARVKVKKVELIDNNMTPLKSGLGFTSYAKWNVRGSVGHWGHIHQRLNQYEANFTVIAVNGQWQITNLEMIKEQRL